MIFNSEMFHSACSNGAGEWQQAAGHVYRGVLSSGWADKLQSGIEQRPGYAEHAGGSAETDPVHGPQTDAAAGPSANGLRGVQIVLDCTDDAAAAMAHQWPGLLNISAAQLQSRMVALKVRSRRQPPLACPPGLEFL